MSGPLIIEKSFETILKKNWKCSLVVLKKTWKFSRSSSSSSSKNFFIE